MADTIPLILANNDIGRVIFPDAVASSVLNIPGFISGMEMANSPTTPATVIDFAFGWAAIGGRIAQNPSLFSKSISGGWVAGSGNGGRFDTPSIINDSWIFCFFIQHNTTGAIDFCFDDTQAGNSIPGSYSKRLLGAIYINNSSSIERFSQYGGYFLWKSPQAVSYTFGTGSHSFRVLCVPPMKGVLATCLLVNASGSSTLTYFNSLSQDDIGYDGTSNRIDTIGTLDPIVEKKILFESTESCRVSCSGSTTFWVHVLDYFVDRTRL